MSRHAEITFQVGLTELKITEGNGALLDVMEEMRLRFICDYARKDNQHRIVLKGLDARASVVDFLDVYVRAVGLHAMRFIIRLIDDSRRQNRLGLDTHIEIRVYE
jgi:hypothetical protein